MPDPDTWLICASILESGQTASAGVEAVVAHSFPSARQQEQKQAAELPAAPLWLCVPAPDLLSFTPMELQNLILPVLPRGLNQDPGIVLSNSKGKKYQAEKLLVIIKAPSLFSSQLYYIVRFLCKVCTFIFSAHMHMYMHAYTHILTHKHPFWTSIREVV